MAIWRPPATLSRQLLADHLSRLSETLERLDERLREGIASAVGQTIASAVREVLLVLLSQETDDTRFPSRHHERASAWDDRDQRLYADGSEDERCWWDEQEDPRWPADRATPERLAQQEPAADKQPRRWVSALAAGWQAATWWLRKPPRRFQVLTAVGVGLAVAAVGLIAGPFAGAGLGVVGTSVGLLAMSTSARSGAARLADLAAD